MLFRSFVGYKPDKQPRSSGNRSGGKESSDEIDKSVFVSGWGGAKLHQDNLPEYMQVALVQVAELEALKKQEGTNG